MRMMTLGMVLGLILTEQAYAGPYYNAPDSGPEEEMAEFEDLLNEARKFIIEMLDSWESNPEAAVEFKGAAVDRLSMAVEVLQSVDELEFAELFVSPDFLKSEMQVAAYSDIGPVLEPLDLGRVDKRDSRSLTAMIQAHFCVGGELGTQSDVG